MVSAFDGVDVVAVRYKSQFIAWELALQLRNSWRPSLLGKLLDRDLVSSDLGLFLSVEAVDDFLLFNNLSLGDGDFL